MRYIFILAMALVIGALILFEYNVVKTSVNSVSPDNSKDFTEQQKQVETQTGDYNQKIEDIKNTTKNAYKDLGQ